MSPRLAVRRPWTGRRLRSPRVRCSRGPDGRTVEPVGVLVEITGASCSLPPVCGDNVDDQAGDELVHFVDGRQDTEHIAVRMAGVSGHSGEPTAPTALPAWTAATTTRTRLASRGRATWPCPRKPGIYQSWCSGEPPLNIYRSDISPNTGVGHSFNEWWDPGNCPMYWAQADNRIRESTWQGQISNVAMKYFHTWGRYNYSLGFSATGPSVSITPTTSTWSANLYLSFSH